MTLKWFLFYWSHDVCWETGLYRIDNRAIQRAVEWVAWSYCSREFKPLHPWHHIYWFLFLLYRCVALVLFLFIMTSSCPSRTRFACFHLLRFRCWRNVPVHVWQRVHTSSCVVFSLFLLLNIFTFCWVLIAIIFPTKLVSSQSAFLFKSHQNSLREVIYDGLGRKNNSIKA